MTTLAEPPFSASGAERFSIRFSFDSACEPFAPLSGATVRGGVRAVVLGSAFSLHDGAWISANQAGHHASQFLSRAVDDGASISHALRTFTDTHGGDYLVLARAAGGEEIFLASQSPFDVALAQTPGGAIQLDFSRSAALSDRLVLQPGDIAEISRHHVQITDRDGMQLRKAWQPNAASAAEPSFLTAL